MTRSEIQQGWKVFAHDLSPPVRGGAPLPDWSGETPYQLPAVTLDTSVSKCAAGWSYCGEMADALRVAGLWPTGRPSRVARVVASSDAIEHDNKRRASSLLIERWATDGEIAAGVLALSAPFGEHAEYMCAEQLAWADALGRWGHNERAVQAGLRAALDARGLSGWALRRYPSARVAWSASAAEDAWSASAAEDAWAAWAAGDAWAAWAAGADAWAVSVWFAAWNAGSPRSDAWDARAALTVAYASRRGLVSQPADLLTVGLRDAYASGLGVALPVGDATLGWAMDDKVSA